MLAKKKTKKKEVNVSVVNSMATVRASSVAVEIGLNRPNDATTRICAFLATGEAKSEPEPLVGRLMHPACAVDEGDWMAHSPISRCACVLPRLSRDLTFLGTELRVGVLLSFSAVSKIPSGTLSSLIPSDRPAAACLHPSVYDGW